MKSNEAPKPVAVPQTGQSKGKGEDNDDSAAGAVQPKSGLFPTGLSRAMVIGSVLIALAAVTIGLFGDRYALIASSRSENSFAYRIDRMTGEVSFCSPASCVPLPDKPEAAK